MGVVIQQSMRALNQWLGEVVRHYVHYCFLLRTGIPQTAEKKKFRMLTEFHGYEKQQNSANSSHGPSLSCGLVRGVCFEFDAIYSCGDQTSAVQLQ